MYIEYNLHTYKYIYGLKINKLIFIVDNRNNIFKITHFTCEIYINNIISPTTYSGLKFL